MRCRTIGNVRTVLLGSSKGEKDFIRNKKCYETGHKSKKEFRNTKNLIAEIQ